MRSLLLNCLCVVSWHFFFAWFWVLSVSLTPLGALVACCSLVSHWSNTTWRCRPGFYLAFCTINCSRSRTFVLYSMCNMDEKCSCRINFLINHSLNLSIAFDAFYFPCFLCSENHGEEKFRSLFRFLLDGASDFDTLGRLIRCALCSIKPELCIL